MTVLLSLLLGCGHEDANVTSPPDLTDRLAFVEVTPAEELPVAMLPAEVVPAPGAVSDLGPAVEGRLVRWHVAPGDDVVAGAALAELQSAELSTLEARARELWAVVDQHTKLVGIRQAAVERGVASSADLGVASASLAEARAAHEAVRRQLVAHRDTTTREGSGWTWRSPTTGVVSEVRCALGSVEASRTCLTVVQPEGVVLEVGVPERHLAHLDGPSRASFTAADGRTWAFGELSRAPTVDPRSRSRTFRYAVLGDGAPLQGMSGRALLTVIAPSDAHVVPIEAVTRIDAVPTVFVFGEGGPRPRAVELLGRDGDQIVISGLEDGDRVAVRGVFLLKSLALMEEG